MKFFKSPLTIFSFFLIIVGIILNVRMFLIQAWPTYIFFIIILIGIIFALIDIKIRHSVNFSLRTKYTFQVLLVVFLISIATYLFI